LFTLFDSRAPGRAIDISSLNNIKPIQPIRLCSSKPEKVETFASLFRSCKFTQMGDPVGKVVVGKIYHIVEEDLYIDLGLKFPCVCQKPR